MRRLTLLALAVATVGCTQPQPNPPPPSVAETACNAARYQSLVGKALSPADEAALPAKHRVICFGCMATMDFVADRLTIQLGPGKTVASVRCG